MAKSARAAMGVADLTVIADRGYFKGEEILACHEAGIHEGRPGIMKNSPKIAYLSELKSEF
jgi:hypothetical protein